MVLPTYHLFTPTSFPITAITDYVVAGDGVYGVLDCFGIRVPVPLVLCDIRGLPPLFPLLHGETVLGMTPHADVDESSDSLAFVPSYHILTEDAPSLPPIDPRRVYQYVIGKEGVFLLASGTGLEVLMPISPRVTLPGLASVKPGLHCAYPPVDEAVVLTLIERSKAAKDGEGEPIERLFYILWDGERWIVHEPEQVATRARVRAKEVTEEFRTAFFEGHSHHAWAANFSDGDNIAEVDNGDCRVYFVVGRLFSQPELRMRLCIHGYVWEIPASLFFTIPPGVVDCVEREQRSAQR